MEVIVNNPQKTNRRRRNKKKKTTKTVVISNSSAAPRGARARRNRNKNATVNTSSGQQYLKLANCSAIYAVALTNPFAMLKDVCIPDFHDAPSWKLRTVIRGEFRVSNSAGSAGFGYIVVSSIARGYDTPIFAFTTPAYNPALPDVISAIGTTGIVQGGDPQFPYSGTQMIDGRALCRVAARGLRIRYTGTNLNMGGRGLIYRVQTDQSLAAHTLVELFSRADATPFSVNRGWKGISYIPQKSSDYEYAPGAFQLTSDADGRLNYDMIILVKCPSNEAIFEFEIVSYYELINGTESVPNISPTHSDVTGFSAIRNSLEGKNFQAGPAATESLFDSLKNYAPQSVSHFVSSLKEATTAANAVKDAAGIFL